MIGRSKITQNLFEETMILYYYIICNKLINGMRDDYIILPKIVISTNVFLMYLIAVLSLM